MTETTTYFNTPSEEWNFLSYYKHRRNENNFTFSFRKESFLLKKNLESRQKISKAKQLLEAFKNHRQHNEDVNIFWNEIELMYLEYEKNLRTKRCHVNISSKTQDMMENMAEETVKAHLATTKDSNDEINDFFQSSSEQQLPTLFSDRDHCSKCHMEVNALNLSLQWITTFTFYFDSLD
uniref:Uncharacterized protein n=1 Tax=Rhizophagus irregularis (strain DAOM 181602 / DAOM 197198 / MUCL 43194) TaxID=747089 RepID=U9T747_RHIID